MHLPADIPRKRVWLLSALAVAILGLITLALRPAPSASGGRRIVLYQDSMHPWIQSDAPGKCTVCGMSLTPIYAGEKGFGISDPLVVLHANGATVLHVQAAEIKRRPLVSTLRVAGTLEANPARQAVLSAPGPGRIESLAVKSVGVEVTEGEPLLKFFSPEWAQTRRYLSRAAAVTQMGPTSNMAPAASKPEPFSSDLVAPLSGTVTERPVFAGQYVAEGVKLLTVVDQSVLWFGFDVYQRQLPWLALGQTLNVEVEGVPGKVFAAVVSLIEPSLSDATRAVKVRADIVNPVLTTHGHPQRLLRLGMYAEGRVRTEVPDVLAIARTAILFPGGTAYAYVDNGNGCYERRAVKLGRQGDDHWEILDGLMEGDRVVTSGNVLIDAQAQLNQGGHPDPTGVEELADARASLEHPQTGAGQRIRVP